MDDIKKEELQGFVFVTAHNRGELSDDVQSGIDAFDIDIYRRFLNVGFERRQHADNTGEDGGGTKSVEYLMRALANLEFILSH